VAPEGDVPAAGEAAAADRRVLVLIPPGRRDGPVTCGLLAEAGMYATLCADMAHLCGALAAGAGAAAVLVDEVLTPEALRMLAGALAAQPPWSDFPLIILAGGGRGTPESQLALAELGSFTNATILERPLRVATLVSAVKVALGSRERQYELRAHLRERELMEARREELLRQQRRIAQTLQLSLLKTLPPDVFPPLDIATRYEPAGTEALVGGDFYDVFGFDGKVALIVGDVVGKGLTAASHMAEVKFALRAIVREQSDPARALARLDEYVTGFEPSDFDEGEGLVAVLLAVIDAGTGRASIAAAGAEPPLLLREGRGVVPLEANGVLIGATRATGIAPAERAAYQSAELILRPGDTLFLTTDGITEARRSGRGREFFGPVGLSNALQGAASQPGATLDSILESVLREARAFSGAGFRDDVCLLAAHWRGNGGDGDHR
jgi:serine phosphatase RsbU (regulator of sigma subunit)